MVIFPMRSESARRDDANTTIVNSVRRRRLTVLQSMITANHERELCYPVMKSIPEVQLDGYKGGWIEIIAGGMFSGKSEELIRRLRRALIARQRVQVFKPLIDDRFATDDIVSRDDRRLKALAVATSRDLRARIEVGVPGLGIG